MDKYTIFDQAIGAGTAVAAVREVDSLADSARRDLDAALQLLAQRAQYLTGASGASIALRDGGEMVCRAGAGRAAPEVGAEIETASGLIAECLRARQVMRCDNADTDPRVNRDSCHELGVKSVMVMPLVHDRDVVGVFELVADGTSAFQENDVTALLRLKEMALTAVEHADAAQRGLPDVSEGEREEALPAAEAPVAEVAKPTPVDEELTSAAAEPLVLSPAELARIGSCEACGFPVSQGRKLCVDCERAERSAESKPAAGDPSVFPGLNMISREESWFQAHGYTLGALFIAALTIALLAIKFR
jgi:putative methionine-R-sulfoxide reductase with GAF domain